MTVINHQTRWEKLQSILESCDWSHLNPEQKDLLFQIIQQHQELFIVHPGELGLIQAEPAHIQVDDPMPCCTPLYRYPEKAKEAIQSILKELEGKGIIESSTAAWLSSIVLVNKPGGDKRLCLDYRKENKQLAMDIHPLPVRRVSEECIRKRLLCHIGYEGRILPNRPRSIQQGPNYF